MSNRRRFTIALALINLAVAWGAMAFVPKVPPNGTSASSRALFQIKMFFLTHDWSAIFAIVAMTVLLTVAIGLILSSYGKLPTQTRDSYEL
jgi:hypothetical protein